MTTPTLWHPFPGDVDCWDRYFRAGVEYPLNGVPCIQGWCERTYNTSQGPKTERMPSMDVSVSETEIIADQELLACMAMPIDQALKNILYILWSRKAFGANPSVD